MKYSEKDEANQISRSWGFEKTGENTIMLSLFISGKVSSWQEQCKSKKIYKLFIFTVGIPIVVHLRIKSWIKSMLPAAKNDISNTALKLILSDVFPLQQLAGLVQTSSSFKSNEVQAGQFECS